MRNRRLHRPQGRGAGAARGTRSLEYRGYDSAGLAVIHRNRLQVTKTAGRVQDLRDRVSDRTKATIGIGHTRWATHGEPNEVNAHPHTDTEGRIAVVHNGIIENAEQLRDALSGRGVKLVSETDTEALAHMIAAEAADGVSLEEAVRRTLRHVEGTYGLVVLDTKNPNELVVARNGSPIVLGIGESEMFVASDVAALVRYTKQVVYLDDAEVATVHATDYVTAALDERDRRGPGRRRARRRPRWRPRPATTSSARSRTSCARRSTSSRRRCAGRCAAGSTSGSPPPGSAASTWTRASSGRSGR